MPLERHPHLAPYSREHHGFLILAQLLRTDAPNYRGLPTTMEGKQQYALRVYEQEMLPHMELEEKVLFPKVIGYHPEIDAMINVLIDDHVEIQDTFKKMQGDSTLFMGSSWVMNDLGVMIRDHIRMEERSFFELIQKHAQDALKGSLR